LRLRRGIKGEQQPKGGKGERANEFKESLALTFNYPMLDFGEEGHGGNKRGGSEGERKSKMWFF